MADMLASLVDLATLLGKTEADPLDNSSGTLAIEAATAVVQAAAGQRIVRATTVDGEVWGSADRVLPLPQRPVVSVASVTFAGSVLTEGTASGTWRRVAGGVWRDLGWAEVYGEPSKALVTWTHGYLDSDQEIQLARGVTLSIARGLYENPTGAVREQIDDYAVAYAEAAAALEARPSVVAMLRKQYGRKAGMVRVV